MVGIRKLVQQELNYWKRELNGYFLSLYRKKKLYTVRYILSLVVPIYRLYNCLKLFYIFNNFLIFFLKM